MKVLFYVTDQGVTCYQESSNVVDRFKWEEFDLIDDHLASLSEKVNASIIFDVIEEDIYFEWAPKVLPWEKKSYLERRKKRFQSEEFLLSELQWTHHQQETESGRKEELILTSLLSNEDNFERFLASLEEAQVLVTQIYTKPFLLVEYFKKRVKPYLKLSNKVFSQPCLVVVRESECTFRQIFFYEGQLRISRLIEIDSDESNMTKALVHETKLAVTYALNQNFMAPDSMIGLVFLDGDTALLDSLLEECRKEGLVPETSQKGGREFNALTFDELSKNHLYCCGVDNDAFFSQQAVVEFVFTDRPKGFYSTPYIEKINHLILGKQLLIALNVMLLLGGVYYIVISGVNAVVSWQKQALLEQKISEYQVEVVHLKDIVKLQDDAQHVKASVEFSEAILQLKVNRVIGFDINLWSDVFQRHEHIQISRMEWKTLERFDSQKSEILLSAWVYPFYGTYADPVKWVDEFVADFKTLPGVEEVVLQKEPLNRDLSQTLVIEAQKESVEALPFDLKVSVKDVQFK